jgi:hypothetical protein
MKYLLLLRNPAGGPPESGTAEMERLYAGYARAAKAMADAGGTVVECRPLQVAESATTVRVRDHQTLLTDGPAAELREQVGGFALIDCADLDLAVRYAELLPAAEDGSVEIRPIVVVEPR